MLRSRNRFVAITVDSLLAAVVCFVLILISIIALNFFQVDVQPLEDIQQLFIPRVFKFIHPKPQEKFIFLTTVLLLPLLCFIANKFILSLPRIYWQNPTLNILSKAAVSLSFLSLFMFYKDPCVVSLITLSTQSWLTVFTLSLISIGLMFYLMRENVYNSYQRFLFMTVPVAAFLFQIVFSRIMSIYSVDGTWPWVGHFEALYYAVTQTVYGKTLLADLPAPYGLFPELLKPLFVMTGLSVFKFTLLMGCLQFISLMCILVVLRNSIRNLLLVLLCALCLCIMTGNTWRLINFSMWDAYYAYYPIRFIFPALFMLCIANFIKHKNIRHCVTVAIVAALSLLWNIDSGIPVAGTLLIYLAAFTLFPQKNLSRRQAINYLGISFSVIIAIVALFCVYLYFKSHHTLQLSESFKYQKLIYMAGYGLIPMPKRLDMWQVIVALYVVGISNFIHLRLTKITSQNAEVIFCLSILGVGLFLYYQGESSSSNLINVSWPAIMLSFIFTDQLFQLIKTKCLPKISAISSLPVLTFAVFTAANFIIGSSIVYQFGKTHWLKYFNKVDTPITQNVTFMKKNLAGKKSVGILLGNQAIYYSELGLASAIKGPGYVEAVLVSDVNNMLLQLAEGNAEVLFLTHQNNQIPEELQQVLEHYKIVSCWQSIACLKRILPHPAT